MDKFKENFREEAYDLLNNLEQSLLELENDPENQDEISAVFRCMHTIKGSASMFGFQEISNFAHVIETVLELVRDGTLTLDVNLINITLAVRDHIRRLLDVGDDGTVELSAHSTTIVAQLQDYVAGRSQPVSSRHGIVPVSSAATRKIGADEVSAAGSSTDEGGGDAGDQEHEPLPVVTARSRPALDVLLVDDNRLNRLVNRKTIEQLGHKVETAGDGLEALEKLSKASFDVVLMDVEMPIMGGFESSGRIRNGEAGDAAKQTPIVALTAHTGEREQRRAELSGMNGFLSKPFTSEMLASALASAVGGNNSISVSADALGRFVADARLLERQHAYSDIVELATEARGFAVERGLSEIAAILFRLVLACRRSDQRAVDQFLTEVTICLGG